MHCVMDHIVLDVEDDEAMLAFYTDVLQLAPERVEEYRAGAVPFPSVRLNASTIIDLFPRQLWPANGATGQRQGNLNHFCISLSRETWQELVQRLAANRIAIEQGPVARWGAHGTGTSIYFRDPEGNLIEARHYLVDDAGDRCVLGS